MRTRPGFTLVELAVVLAILGVMAAAAVPALGVWLDREPTPAEALAKLLRDARAHALETARPVTVTLNPGSGAWLLETEEGPARHGRLALGDAEVSSHRGPDNPRVVVRFAPTGGADSDPILVQQGREGSMRRVVIRANRWTGEVLIHEP